MEELLSNLFEKAVIYIETKERKNPFVKSFMGTEDKAFKDLKLAVEGIIKHLEEDEDDLT